VGHRRFVGQGEELTRETQVLYISPLKALGNDIQKKTTGPLARLRELDPTLPEISVMVRSGDTTPAQRAAMRRRSPHILVTTPESLHIL
jgi:ATP-dependent Lhr-like helicase